MAKKQREVLAFVRKTKGAKDILFAVVGMPERTTAPKETAHYILFSRNKNKRYKWKSIKVKVKYIAKAVVYARYRYFSDCDFIEIIPQS